MQLPDFPNPLEGITGQIAYFERQAYRRSGRSKGAAPWSIWNTLDVYSYFMLPGRRASLLATAAFPRFRIVAGVFTKKEGWAKALRWTAHRWPPLRGAIVRLEDALWRRPSEQRKGLALVVLILERHLTYLARMARPKALMEIEDRLIDEAATAIWNATYPALREWGIDQIMGLVDDLIAELNAVGAPWGVQVPPETDETIEAALRGVLP